MGLTRTAKKNVNNDLQNPFNIIKGCPDALRFFSFFSSKIPFIYLESGILKNLPRLQLEYNGI